MIQVLWILIKNTSQYKDSNSNIMHDDSVSKLKEWIWDLDHATEKGNACRRKNIQFTSLASGGACALLPQYLKKQYECIAASPVQSLGKTSEFTTFLLSPHPCSSSN